MAYMAHNVKKGTFYDILIKIHDKLKVISEHNRSSKEHSDRDNEHAL